MAILTLDTAHFGYRITPRTPRTFIQCSTYVKEGVRVINRYINQNFFTSMPRVWGHVGQGWKTPFKYPREASMAYPSIFDE